MFSFSTSICFILLCVTAYAAENTTTTTSTASQPVAMVVSTTATDPLSEYIKNRLNFQQQRQGQIVPSPGVLVSLGEDYSTDFQNVYYKRMLISGASASSFQVFREDYAKDANNAYYKGFQIPGALSNSFEVLYGGDYAKDANNVYYKGLQVLGASASTFQVHMKDEYGKDANHMYYKGRQIPGSPNNGLPMVAFGSSEDSHEIFFRG